MLGGWSLLNDPEVTPVTVSPVPGERVPTSCFPLKKILTMLVPVRVTDIVSAVFAAV